VRSVRPWQLTGFDFTPKERRQLLEHNPSFDALARVGHMNGIGKQVGVLRQCVCDVNEWDFSRFRISAEDPVLEVRETADVGVTQRPEYGVELLIDELVTRGRERDALGGEPLE